MTAHKAWTAALVGFLGPILTFLAGWLASSADWSWRMFAAAVVGSAITSVTAGGFTWYAPYRPKTLPEHSAAAVALENSHSSSMEA